MQNYERTVKAIANYIGDQHPDVSAYMGYKHKLHLSNALREFHKNRVAYGPFKGLQFTTDSHWGLSDKGTMILGLYEQEVLQELQMLPAGYNVFIDLGAAD